MKTRSSALMLVTAAVTILFGCAHLLSSPRAVNLFPADGPPAGWVARHWADVRNPPPAGAIWKVEGGVLNGSTPRGTWLLSEQEYGDFHIAFDWKLPERGNSGFAIRAPMYGDPAFDGMELQMVDPRYFPTDEPPQASELSASLYRAIAPTRQLYKPDDWNHYDVTARGSHIKVIFNGVVVQDVNLDTQDHEHPKRHDDTDAPTLQDRPRRGHIGFQELSRGGGHVQIRNIQFIDYSS